MQSLCQMVAPRLRQNPRLETVGDPAKAPSPLFGLCSGCRWWLAALLARAKRQTLTGFCLLLLGALDVLKHASFASLGPPRIHKLPSQGKRGEHYRKSFGWFMLNPAIPMLAFWGPPRLCARQGVQSANVRMMLREKKRWDFGRTSRPDVT